MMETIGLVIPLSRFPNSKTDSIHFFSSSVNDIFLPPCHRRSKNLSAPPTSKKWMRIDSYGPKFVENIVQAVSRDVLSYAMRTLKHCFICGHIHDELIIECRPDVSNYVNRWVGCRNGSQTSFFALMDTKHHGTAKTKKSALVLSQC